MIADDFATLLQDIGSGTVGSDIFVLEQPDDLDEGLVVANDPSGDVHKYTGQQRQSIGVFSVSKSSITAAARLETLKRALHRREGITTAGHYIYSIVTVGNMMDLDRDALGRRVWKLSFDVFYRDLDWVS